jgi:poly(3-hydroxybutyrate) depolymerase
VVSSSSCLPGAGAASALPAVEGLIWEDVELTSTFDGATQAIIAGVPRAYVAGQPTPLLVALHTWSADYRQQPEAYGPEAAARGWLLVLPDFRGPNLDTNPRATEAGGSLAAQHDIADAVAYMQATYAVDPDRIYLSGASGGGHMALLMAGKHPDLWAGVVAWCPVTDLRDWHGVGNAYAQHVQAVCGGPPGASPEVDFEYLGRSPRTFITSAASTNLLIGHGDRDETIPTAQTWATFSRLRAVPAHRTVFRSWCGGHEEQIRTGLDWASEQRRAATPPGWLDILTDEAKWYSWLLVEPAEPLRLARAVARAEQGLVAVEVEHARRLEIDFRKLEAELPASVSLDGEDPRPTRIVAGQGTMALTPPDPARHRFVLR